MTSLFKTDKIVVVTGKGCPKFRSGDEEEGVTYVLIPSIKNHYLRTHVNND